MLWVGDLGYIIGIRELSVIHSEVLEHTVHVASGLKFKARTKLRCGKTVLPLLVALWSSFRVDVACCLLCRVGRFVFPAGS
jgi:hypothetical protein